MILDALIAQRLKYVITNNISLKQHGFVPVRSTLTNLTIFNNNIATTLFNRDQHVIYIDFAKAFDSVDHGLLISWLYRFNIKGNILSFFLSFLKTREQRVKIGNTLSNSFIADSGVPQGSHSGPLIFLILINSLVNVINHSQILLFADDVRIYKSVKTLFDASNLNRDLISIVEWSQRNHIDTNFSESILLSFCRTYFQLNYQYILDNIRLTPSNSARDLRIIFHSRFTFNEHIDYIHNKASRILGFIIRSTRDFTDVRCIVYLFKTLVLPCMHYCSSIWTPYYDCHIKT